MNWPPSEPYRRSARVTLAALGMIAAIFCGWLTLSGPSIAHAFETTVADASQISARYLAWKQGGERIVLNKGWTVFRNQIIPAGNFENRSCNLAKGGQSPQPVSIPDIWGPTFTANLVSGHGVATYCLEVQLPDSLQTLGLHLGTIRSIYAVYVLNSYNGYAERPMLLHRNGDPMLGNAQEAGNPSAPDLALPNDLRHFKLVIQVNNYVHKQGGLLEAPSVDLLAHLNAQERRDSSYLTALVLLLSTIAIAALFIGRTQDNSARHYIFAWLAAAAAFRVFLVSDLVWDYFPTFTLSRKYDFEYLSLFLFAPAYYAFICSLFRKGRIQPIDVAMYGLCAICGFFALCVAPFFPPGTITLLREPFQIFCIIIALMLAIIVIKALIRDARHRIDALIVMGAALATIVYEMLATTSIFYSSLELSQLLIIFMTALYVRNFVSNFRQVEAERDALTRSLKLANSDLEKRAQALSQAFARAEESSRAKSEFLATMSHELRTPLNAVIGFSEMMMREIFGKLGAAQYEDYARDIHASGTHLLAVVDDILDLSRVETGNDEVQEENLDVVEIAQLVLSFVRPQAERSNVHCSLDITGPLPLLKADARKMKQILINLVSNAIKFNVENGTVTVRLSCGMAGFVVQVADTGIGMRPEEIPKAMTRFGQIEGALNRKYEGLGIGLSIVQALSAQHGAKFTMESEFGKGSLASVIFPVERCISRERQSA
jgi:signal transduction histidine kinase